MTIFQFLTKVTLIVTISLGCAAANDNRPEVDWLISPVTQKTKLMEIPDRHELVLTNGLISRTFRLTPNAATVGYDNLMTGESVIRGVKPEARIEIDGATFDIGGLSGQPNYAYLLPEWIEKLTSDPKAFQFVDYKAGKTKERFGWKRKRYCADLPWPPPGVSLTMNYQLSPSAALNLSDELLPSSEGRPLLLTDDFTSLSDKWNIHHSQHERSSFTNEGKIGEIYTPMNTCVYAQRKLPPGVRLLQCRINTGTDQSASWGPGLTVLWPQRTVKFYLRPGKTEFGLYDGQRERYMGKIDPAKTYFLRLRIEDIALFCEASLDGQKWFSVEKIELDQPLGDPVAVRLGKTSFTGGNNDYSEPGELGRLLVGAFGAYGSIDPQALEKLAEKTAYLQNLTVSIHYEMYDGIPLLCKWFTLKNNSARDVTINTFTSEILAAVEASSAVESPKGWEYPNIHIETDYAFHGMSSSSANKAVHWQPDPQFLTQVNYQRQTPCLLEVQPPIGPDQIVPPGETFESLRTFELIHDSTDRERKGLAVRHMFRTIAPWVTENPLLMHVRSARPDAVRLAIDQCAEVGFEMVILTFGSGFNIENEDPAYLAQIKVLTDYAHSKGIELGGYSLLASRRVSDEHDVINPATGKPGGFATFGNSPCLGSKWGLDYFRKLYAFYKKTGFDLLEHDGSYPGDVCASTQHPGHRGLNDSQWNQFKTITDFYKWCRARGVYLNVPDWYFLNGSNKTGMGYRETNWSLPRAQQVIHTRQNIFDGTWQKAPSMGWMFVPLTQYHGGGAAATIEPLHEHLDHYERMIAGNLGAGVQACYRGPRLYDTDETKAVVKKWVDFYKKYRSILDSDIIHVRRADGRDFDCILHVNPQLKTKGLAMIYNPTSNTIKKTMKLPLYYTGLTNTAQIREQDGILKTYELDRNFNVKLNINIKPQSNTWFVIE